MIWEILCIRSDHNIVLMSKELRVREKRVNFIGTIYKILGDVRTVIMQHY